MPVTSCIRLVSYNCRGWNNGSSLVCDLLSNSDVCLVQEHWLLHEKLNLLDMDPDFFFHGVSGMDSATLLRGRPYGGCAIFYRKSLSPNISVVKAPSKRSCAISLRDASDKTTLLICVYLPTHYGTHSSYDDFLSMIEELCFFILILKHLIILWLVEILMLTLIDHLVLSIFWQL